MLEVLVLNENEQRAATPTEIEELIADGKLFINYYVHGNEPEIGKAFLDLQDTENFSLKIPRGTQDVREKPHGLL